MKILLWIFVILYGAACMCQTQTFNGTLVNPDGTPLEGSFSISLRGSTLKNICSTPYQIVPNLSQKYSVVHGAIQNISSAHFISQDCLTPRVPYYVTIANNENTTLSSDNWYVPRVQGGIIDVGTMGLEAMGAGPITVSVPVGIISTPSGDQTITQPAGTTMRLHGNYIFDGTVTLPSSSPTYVLIKAPQVLIGGLASSAYPLDVVGLINTSQGYLVNGSGGVPGQCIVSDGSKGIWGTCATPLPALFYQTAQLNTVVQPQRSSFGISGPFTVADDAVHSLTTFSLSTTGPGNLVITTASALTGTGCAHGDGLGGISLLGAACVTGATPTATCSAGQCYRVFPDGTIEEWGTTSGCSGVSCSVSVTFPMSFTTLTNLSLDVSATNAAANTMTSVGSKTVTGFSFQFGAAVLNGGGGAVLSGSQRGEWHAIGN